MKENVFLKGRTKERRVKVMMRMIILSLVSHLLYLACAFDAQESTPDFTAPERPAVIPGDTLMKVRWTKIDTAAGYELYYAKGEAGERVNWKTVSPDDEIIVDDTQLVQITMTGLVNGSTYWVWTKAVYPKGVSEFSEGSSGKPLPKPWDPQAVPLTTGDAGDEYFKAQWGVPGGGGNVQSYELYYNTSGDQPQATDTGQSAVSPAIISGISNNETYYVWVRSVNTAGSSKWVSLGNVTLPDITAAPAASQTAFKVTPGNKRLTVDWTPVSDPLVSRFKVYYTTSSETPDSWDAGSLEEAAETAGDKYLSVKSSMRTTIKPLMNGTPYYVYIRTGNSAGYNDSGFSGHHAAPEPKDPPNLDNKDFVICQTEEEFLNAEYGKGDRLARKQETPYSNLIGDALVWWAGEQGYSTDFAFYNGGLIIDAIGLPKGEVTVSDIRASIKDDKISVVRISGAKVRELFDYAANVRHDGGGGHGTGAFGQVSKEVRYTIDYTYGTDHKYGQINWGTDGEVKISGESVKDERIYTIVTSTYLTGGGDGYAAFSANSGGSKTGIDIWRAVAGYMYDICPPAIRPETDGRIKLINPCWSSAK